MQHYHYIFTGSGLAALLTVREMILSGKFEDKTILLIDESPKTTNDRTWCFWDKTNQLEALVYKEWPIALFDSSQFKADLLLTPYRYKMIRGLDFYQSVFNLISKQKNIQFLNQKVIDFKELGHHCVVKTESQSFTCNQIFNSIFVSETIKKQLRYPLIQQHFVGWFIKSKEAVFTENRVTFMDFSVEQSQNTRFMYVLPFSPTEALLEYTLFSANLLEKAAYETEIKKYIEQLGITEYEIIEKEQGNIPMTSYPFWKHNTKNIINIGSAGGWTKASTGYTFKNALKKSKQLVAFLTTGTDFRKLHQKTKFWYYDLLLIDILFRSNHLGSNIFSSLFKKAKTETVFKFLDEETSFSEDLKIILACPKKPFIRAVWNRIF